MKVLEKIRKVIDLILSSACAIVFAVMVVVGTYQVVVRYFFNSPSTVSEELLTYSFSWMALLSSALVFGKRDHMRMGFIADKLTGVPKKILEIVIELVIMLIAGVPIAVALGISSICAILPVMDTSVAVLTGAQRIFSGISVFSLLAIPFFILAGNIMNKGGIAVRLINLAKLVTGHAPGALAHTNVVANMLFGVRYSSSFCHGVYHRSY